MATDGHADFDPKEIARAAFPTAFRGYDQEAVRRYLSRLAAAVGRAQQLGLLGTVDIEHDSSHIRVAELEHEATELRTRVVELEELLEEAQESAAAAAEAADAAAEVADAAVAEAAEATAAADAAAEQRSADTEAAVPNRELDESELIEQLGHETARIVEAARSAAVDIVQRAEAEASALREQAEVDARQSVEEADAVLLSARTDADVIRNKADAETKKSQERIKADAKRSRDHAKSKAEKILADASAKVEADLSAARQRANQIVADAEQLREEILGDLVRRRRVDQEHLTRLTAARDRLAQALASARNELDDVASEIHLAAPSTADLDLTKAREEADENGSTQGNIVNRASTDSAEVAELVGQLRASRPERVRTPGGASAFADEEAGRPGETESLVGPDFFDRDLFGDVDSGAGSENGAHGVRNRSGGVNGRSKGSNGSNGPATTEVEPLDLNDLVDLDDTMPLAIVTVDVDPTGDEIDIDGDGPWDRNVDRTIDEPTVDAMAEDDGTEMVAAIQADHSYDDSYDEAETPSEERDRVREVFDDEFDLTVDVVDTADAHDIADITDADHIDHADRTADAHDIEAAGETALVDDGFDDEPGAVMVDGDALPTQSADEEDDLLAQLGFSASPVLGAGSGSLHRSATRGDLPRTTPYGGKLPAAFDGRDVALTRSTPGFRRRLKRAVNDDQSDVLDRLRAGRGAISTDELRPLDEQLDGYIEALRPALRDVVTSGGDLLNSLDVPVSAVENLCLQLAKHMVECLRLPTIEVIEGIVDNDREAVLDPVRAIYRDFRNTLLPDLIDDALHEAFALGLYYAIDDGAEVLWMPDPRLDPDPICEENSAAPSLPKGTDFPSGHTRPLSMPGCRCLAIPVG